MKNNYLMSLVLGFAGVIVISGSFAAENPNQTDEGQTFLDHLNPNSLTVTQAFGEPEIASAKVGDRFQFERLGYYIVDPDSSDDKRVFNRIVPLRDSWGKMVAKGKAN